MLKYCISLQNIFFTIEAENEKSAQEKARSQLIQKISNSIIDVWPDYEEDVNDAVDRKFKYANDLSSAV